MPWNLILSLRKALEKFDFIRIQSLFVSEVHCNHVHILIYQIMKHPCEIGHSALENCHFIPEIALEKGKVGTLYKT